MGVKGATTRGPEWEYMIDLTDRVVLITGAAGGIGSATARTLVGAGAR